MSALGRAASLHRVLWLLLALAPVQPAEAERAFALTPGGELVVFDTRAPGSVEGPYFLSGRWLNLLDHSGEPVHLALH